MKTNSLADSRPGRGSHVSSYKKGREGAARRIHLSAWYRSDASLYECRNPGSHQRSSQRRGFGQYRHAGRTLQHLPPASSSRGWDRPRHGRASSFYDMGWPDSHRFRWISGVFPGETAQNQGRRGDLFLSHRWQTDFHGSRAEHADSVQSGLRHRNGFWRMCRKSCSLPLCKRLLWANRKMAGPLQRGIESVEQPAKYCESGTAALGDQSGCHLSGSSDLAHGWNCQTGSSRIRDRRSCSRGEYRDHVRGHRRGGTPYAGR